MGVFDELLEAAVLAQRRPGTLVAFWDVDAPATLERVMDFPDDPFRPLIPQYDLILTYGGGPPVVADYDALGRARLRADLQCARPAHAFPGRRRTRALQADLGFLRESAA